MATVDSSVLLALFNGRDRAHLAAVAWFRDAIADGEAIRAPVIAIAEVAAAIAAGTGDKQLARDIAAHIRHSALIELLPIALPLAERAAVIAAEHGIRSGDAIYFAVAETLKDRLITLDPGQLKNGPAIVDTARPRQA
jgi:predicted nucleic acid-binding protein